MRSEIAIASLLLDYINETSHTNYPGPSHTVEPVLGDHPFCPAKTVSQDRQWFMQDENVACHDLGKVSLERAVGCFGTPQLERATHFPMPQLERATRFPNVPSWACDSLSNVPILARMISSSKSVYSDVFFYNNYFFLSQYAFHQIHVYVLIVFPLELSQIFVNISSLT